MSLRLLLLEDERTDAALARQVLIREGMEDITQFTSVEEAAAAAREGTFDVAILDLNVDDSAGLETVRMFLTRCKETPVVVCSGTADAGHVIDLIRIGVEEFIAKDVISMTKLGDSVLRAYLRRNPWGPESNRVASRLLDHQRTD